jgi:hypothetical protein
MRSYKHGHESWITTVVTKPKELYNIYMQLTYYDSPNSSIPSASVAATPAIVLILNCSGYNTFRCTQRQSSSINETLDANLRNGLSLLLRKPGLDMVINSTDLVPDHVILWKLVRAFNIILVPIKHAGKNSWAHTAIIPFKCIIVIPGGISLSPGGGDLILKRHFTPDVN